MNLEPHITALSTLLSAGPSAEQTAGLLEQGQAAAACLQRLNAPESAVVAALYAPASNAQHPLDQLDPPLDPETSQILDGTRRLSEITWDRIDDTAAETLRNLFLAMARDVRVVLVALSVRVVEMRGLKDDARPEQKKRKLAQETLEIYAPLANRLGIWQFKWELEDHALEILEPEAYDAIRSLLEERGERREQFIQEVTGQLQQRLAREGVACSISGRPKHIFSIYKKMQRKQVSFDELYDISAVRVVTERVADCYAVLGLVHEMWSPIPGEFDDYIATPKANGYQSLHTAVIGPRGHPVEVQIRTEAMHQFAELGVAAHWAYKEQRRAKAQDNERLLGLRRLLDWERELDNPQHFVESLRSEIFEDQVFVFTPNGDVIDLPKGATPVDFAYRVHTMVGHRCRGARINGQIAQLDTKLKTGDRVEILTQKVPKPNRDWMNPALGFTSSPSTRAKVRAWFRQQSKDAAIAEGRESIAKELHRLDVRNVALERVAQANGFASIDELCAAVGYGEKKAQVVAAHALELMTPEESAPLPPSPPTVRRTEASGLMLDGVHDVLAKRGACCKPVPGDEVVGFITRGRGVVIHRRDCNQLQHTTEPERVVDIEWRAQRDERLPVDVEIQLDTTQRHHDNPLSELMSKAASFGAVVESARQLSRDGGATSVVRLGLSCRDVEQLTHIMSRLARESGVLSVRRSSS